MKVLYYILFLSLGGVVLAQDVNSAACKQVLIEALASYSKAPKELPSALVKSFVMTMSTENRGKSKVQESKLEIMMGQNLFVAKNADVLSISDSSFSFTLVKQTKTLIKSKSHFGKLTDSVALGVSKKMLDNIQTFECSDFTQAGITYHKITGVPTKALMDEALIDKIEYVLNHSKKEIMSSTISYVPSSLVKTMSVKYSPLIMVARPGEYTEPVSSIFLTSKNALKAKYSSFQFFDNTKK